MSHDDKVCLGLGREIVRMIGELNATAGKDAGYTRRTFTYRGGGSVEVFLVKTKELAECFDKAAEAQFAVAEVTPPSQVN